MKRQFLTSLMIVILMAAPNSWGSWNHYKEFGSDIVIDKVGNVYFARGGSSTIQPQLVTSKYDKDGRKLWDRQYHAPVDDFGICEGIAIDPEGNVCSTGRVQLRKMATESYDIGFGWVTIKYDADGKQLWERLYDEPNMAVHGPVGIGVDDKGNIYVAGQSMEPDPTLDPNYEKDIDDYGVFLRNADFVVVKYEPNGRQSWSVRYGGPENHLNDPSGIAVDKAGNVYVTGDCTLVKGDYDMYDYSATIKYDTNGRKLWEAQEPNVMQFSDALSLDSAGNVYILEHIFDDSYSALIIIKYGTNGKRKWKALYKRPAEKAIYAKVLAIDRTDNVCVLARICERKSSTGDKRRTSEPQERYEFVTLKYTPDGKKLWMAQYVTPLGHYVSLDDLMFDADGNIYAIGVFQNTPLDSDALIIKYDLHGNQKWCRQFNDAPALVKFLASLRNGKD